MRDRRIEEALAAWRAAEQRLENATDGDRQALQAEAVRQRAEFQRQSAEFMIERLDALHAAEARRMSAQPSTPPFHEAAKEEMAIAEDIWSAARVSDEETPNRNQSN